MVDSSTDISSAGALEHELQIITEEETLRVPITGIVLGGSEYDARCQGGGGEGGGGGGEGRGSPVLGPGVKLLDLNPRFGAFGSANGSF